MQETQVWSLCQEDSPGEWSHYLLQYSWEFLEQQERVNSKANQPWIFIGRTDAETEAPTLWPPDVKSWLTGKDPKARKDWGKAEKGVKEDEMVGWHHWLNGDELEQTLADNEEQGSPVCCSPWGGKELDIVLSEWTTTGFYYVRLMSFRLTCHYMINSPTNLCICIRVTLSSTLYLLFQNTHLCYVRSFSLLLVVFLNTWMNNVM